MNKKLVMASPGVTLLETIVVITVMTLLLVIVTQIYAVSYDVYEKQAGRTSSDVGAVLAVRAISESLRGAVEVLAIRTINGTSYSSSVSSLVVKLPSIDSAGNPISGSYDYAAVFKDGADPKNVMADIETAAGSVRGKGKRRLSGYNDTLTFRYNNEDITKASRVSVYIVNSQTVRGATITTRAWTSLFLRNLSQ